MGVVLQEVCLRIQTFLDEKPKMTQLQLKMNLIAAKTKL